MVHVSSPQRKGFGSALGGFLGALGGRAYNQYEQKNAQELEQQQNQQRQSLLNSALTQAQQVYADPNLTPEQKQISLYQVLSSRPEIAQALAPQLQKIQQQNQKQSMIANLFGGGQQQPGQPQQSSPGMQNQSRQQIQPGQDQNTQQSQGNNSQFDPTKLSDAQIAQVAALDPQLGRTLQQQKDVGLRENRAGMEFKDKQLQKKIDRASERNKPVYDETRKLRRSLPTQTADLNAMEDAIKNQDLSFLSKDNLADIFHIEGLRTAKGAQLKTAIKNHFAASVGKFGGRPNQYIEQQIAQTFPQVGRTQEANQTSLELLKFDHDINKKYLETVDKFEDLYSKDLGYVPETLERDVDNFMKEYVEQRQNQLESSLKEISKFEGRKGKGQKLSPDIALQFLQQAGGDRQKAEKMAKDEGYEF